MTQLQAIVDPVSGLLWGSILIYVLLGAGLYFSVRTRFVQLRHFGHLWRVVLGSRQGAQGGISSFQAFCIGLASRVGTGNIAGVAIALTVGGPGAIFWMWCVAALGMATAFVEATLAQIFKVHAGDGTYRGGPAYYIERGLGSRRWGVIFSVLLIFTFGIAFNGVQANTIADVLRGAHTVPPTYTGVILAVLAAPVFFGGMRAIARVAEVLLPAMALSYILLGMTIVLINIGNVPHALSLIVQSAFGVAPAAGGIAGGFAAALLNGVKRGLFSNEAGMGSAPNTAATATVSHPAIQGFVQSLGVFIDTMVICTMTALIVLVSGLYDGAQASGGAALTQAAVVQTFGSAGQWFMTVIVFAFAFSSVLGNYAYADANLSFLGAGSRVFLVFRLAALFAVFAGSVAELPLVWALADVAMGLMTLVNITALLGLSRWALAALRDYESALVSGQPPEFGPIQVAALPGTLLGDVWLKPAAGPA
jgi:AGCS family alanine or glycine:cation symporter